MKFLQLLAQIDNLGPYSIFGAVIVALASGFAVAYTWVTKQTEKAVEKAVKDATAGLQKQITSLTVRVERLEHNSGVAEEYLTTALLENTIESKNTLIMKALSSLRSQ